MKGMVFVELLSMADKTFGEEMVDDVVDGCNLASGGAYNAVGNYPCSELMALVEGFSQRSGASAADLQVAFGRWMLDRFSRTYPEFFKDKPDPFSMLEAIESEVHVEVLKLYPDAELPRFETHRLDENRLRMTYSSPRPLVKFCQGLIEACVEHFDRKAEIEVTHGTENGRTTADFTVTLVA